MAIQRKLVSVANAEPSADGAGVKIRRLAGRSLQRVMDPFLMLDEIRSDDSADYIGGFPSHPHRGFETITYMLRGKMRHADHLGNDGLLQSGDVQWMLAGRGVIHSEMPEQSEGLMHGFQLWLNLPAAQKMQPPAYRDLPAETLPEMALDSGAKVKLLLGKARFDARCLRAPVERPVTEPVIMDVELAAGASLGWHCGEQATVMVYVYDGALPGLNNGQLGVYAQGDELALQAGDQAVRVLVVAGLPLREPIAQYGPFVMNSVEEIEQALVDYNNGALVE